MKTLKQLEAEGYRGADASLEISLFEQGLVWRELVDEDTKKPEYRFIYGTEVDDQGRYAKFDWAWLPADVDPGKEWNWVDWPSVLVYVGMLDEGGDEQEALAEWMLLPLERQVQDLLGYYGYGNVFGTAYHPFKIRDPEKEET
jgi:hypothetical protein